MSDSRKQQARKDLFATIALGLIRGIGSTLRLNVEGFERFEKDDHKLIFCGWHGKSFIFANQFRNKGYWVIISNSNDGDIQNRVFTKLGYQSIRGSTGRGGVRAALEGVRKLKEGGTMAITPDGPRGPSRIVQGGVMLMAQKSGAALVPVGIVAKWAWISKKSWDSYMLPLPFSPARISFGEPIYVPANATEEELEAIRLLLQEKINELEAKPF